MIDGYVTRRFLRKRFWIATLLLLIAVAGSAWAMVSALQAQAGRNRHAAAVLHLSDAATRLELDVTRLAVSPAAAMPDRGGARAAFVDLLTGFRAFSTGESRPGPSADAGLASLSRAFGVEPAAAAKRRQLTATPTPEALKTFWTAPAQVDAVTLETAIARVLEMSAPVIRDSGGSGLGQAERERSSAVVALLGSRIRPALTEAAGAIDAEIERAGNRTVLLALALAGCCAVVALANMIVIFRPLERTVMGSQADLIAQRDAAIEADGAKRHFLSVVSHELRTPMNGILGFASLLLTAELRPEHRRQVEIIQSSGRSLLTLVNDILDISKLEAGSLELADENFSLEEVISGVVNLLRGTAAAKDLEMSVCLDTRLPEHLRGDGNRLRQILTNLVGNAITFTDSGGIDITAREIQGSGEPGAGGPGGGRALVLEVSDTGIGIAVDQQERIFEQFTRITTDTRRRAEGTGLGLAICKQMAEMMGGRILVESAPGFGSTFSLRIPLRQAIPPVAESEWRRRAVDRLTGRRVLVVGRESINRGSLRRQLAFCGMRAYDAAKAGEALQLLRASAEAGDPYEVAVICHRMPETDGIDLARRIRSDARIAGVSLLLSAPAAVQDLHAAGDLAFDAVEESPILPQALIEAVSGLVDAGPDRDCAAGPSPGGAGGRVDGADGSGGSGGADGSGGSDGGVNAPIQLVEDNPVGRRTSP